MMGVQGWGAGRAPSRAGFWTGEVVLSWVLPKGTHDLKRGEKKNMTEGNDF